MSTAVPPASRAPSPGASATPRTCMRDHIRSLVAARILSGEYPPGMRIKELALAADCDTSQAPVREALRDLEALGLVESERFRGTRVRGADVAELREAYELRALIEQRAAQLAVPCMPAVIAELRSELRRMRQAVRAGDSESHADAAIRFHRGIVAASGNRAFLQSWDSLHWGVRTRIAVARAISLGISFSRYTEAHAVILDALEAGDGAQAGQLLRDLLDRFSAALETKHRARGGG